MTERERWQRVQALCDALDEVAEDAWPARLHALEADTTLHAETLALRDAMRAEAAFSPPPSAARPALISHPDVIGGVQVLSRLGAGGSGEVFRGVRTVNGVEQSVAVKRFHQHRAQGADLGRVAREQQMLAALSHPDIVRLLDAGVDHDGRPYLVMDLVQGDAITSWCDERRLPLAARLRLFLLVCAAVQSAHRHLIVHLDLKPGNILVTADGRPKLLDFGTAKLAGPDVQLTSTEPLTLQYASPERLRGEPVSVACDVYSLGLILYELVSGAWPFRRSESLVGVAERASGASSVLPLPRGVTEDAAAHRGTSLSGLRASLRGDLEAIAEKALAHAPAERYATVSELADDVGRYLDGEPVRARPPRVSYRLGKFLRRHALETASVVLLIMGLAAAAVYSAQQARVSERAAVRARAQNRILASLLTLAGNDASSGPSMTVSQLLGLADERVVPTLAAMPDVAGDIEFALAQGWLAQGDMARTEQLARRSLTRATGGGDRPREAMARALLSYVNYATNRSEGAVQEAREALRIWSAHEADFSDDAAIATLARGATTLAYVNPADDEAAPYFEACLRLTGPADTAGPSPRHSCLFGLAAVRYNAHSDFATATRLLTEAAAIQRADPSLAASLAITLQLTGLVQRSAGRFEDDERLQREALAIMERLQGTDSVAALWQRAIWATSLVGAGRAVAGYREALDVLAAGRRHFPARGATLMWTPLSAASTAACYLERVSECDALAREALETLGPNPAPNDTRARTARGLLGLALAKQGRIDEARPMIQAAIDGTIASKRASLFLTRWQAALVVP